MVQYDFLMANFLAAIMFLLIMANFGAADDIYGDEFVVIDSTNNPDALDKDYDFDLDSIKFTPSYDTGRLQSTPLKNGSVIYTANMTFGDDGRLSPKEGAPFGEVAYDVAARDDTVFLPYDNNAFFSDNTQFLLSEQVPPNNTREGVTSIPYDEIVGDSPIGLNLENQSTLLIGIEGGTGAYVSVEGTSVEPSSGITESVLDTVTFDFYSTAANAIKNATLAIVEVPRMIGGYIDFTLSVPGLLGTLLRLYFGVLLTILLVDLIWLG